MYIGLYIKKSHSILFIFLQTLNIASRHSGENILAMLDGRVLKRAGLQTTGHVSAGYVHALKPQGWCGRAKGSLKVWLGIC